MPANEGVFDNVHQSRAQVKLTGDVGRGHDDDERLLLGIDLRGEIAPFQPKTIPLGFCLLRIIGFGNLPLCHLLAILQLTLGQRQRPLSAIV